MTFSDEKTSRVEKLEASVSIVIGALLWLIRYVVASIVGSIAVLADACHSLVDALTSSVVLISSKIADRSPTERFPYGYGKAVTLGTLAIGICIVATAGELMREIYDGVLAQKHLITYDLLTIATPIVFTTGIAKYVLGVWAHRLGRKYSSSLCVADAKHHIVDAYVTFGVTLSLVAIYLIGLNVIDVAVSAIIAVLIVIEGISVMKSSVLELMDRSESSLARRVQEIASKVNGVVSVHNVRVRGYGRYYIAELSAHVRSGVPVEVAHRISHEVERLVRAQEPRIREVVVHIEPDVPHD